MDEGSRGRPADKILCEGRFQRYVLACMRNCPYGDPCREFWAFFRERGETPQQYLRRHGIEEDYMKRIVFDCDRCGKRDIGEPWTLWQQSGEAEGQRLPEEAVAALFEKAGPLGCTRQFAEVILDALKAQHGFEHYCEACFRKVASLAGQIVGRPPQKLPAAASAASPVAKALAPARPVPVVRKAPELVLEQSPTKKPGKPGPKPGKKG